MDLVTVKGLSKRYGGIVALSEATFSARAGEVHALLGENGAGKSTFIQILSGAVQHDGGSILVDGQEYRPAHPDAAQALGIAAVTCAQTQGAKCILGSNPAYLSSEAIKLAVDILDTGKKPAERSISVKGDFVTTDPFESKLYPGTKMIKIAIGENAFPDQAPGLTLPITPDWVEITAAEAAGAK